MCDGEDDVAVLWLIESTSMCFWRGYWEEKREGRERGE